MHRMMARSRFIEMVADGDLTIVELTRDGPRYEYTRKGLTKVCPACRNRGAAVIVLASLATNVCEVSQLNPVANLHEMRGPL